MMLEIKSPGLGQAQREATLTEFLQLHCKQTKW